MKKTLITLFVVLISFNLAAQKMYTVPWYNWSSPISYQLSPSPFITGYGYHSDSLSNAFEGTTFYVYNNEYYPIRTWADYYYWYVNKYWYNFSEPGLYEYYYRIKDDFQMAQYIAGSRYRMRYYPSRICISFHHKVVEVNRLCKNSRYIASNDKQVQKLMRLDDLAKKQSKNRHKQNNNRSLVNKTNTISKSENRNQNRNNRNNNNNITRKELKLSRFDNTIPRSTNANIQNRNRTGYNKQNNRNRSSSGRKTYSSGTSSSRLSRGNKSYTSRVKSSR